MGPLPRSAFWTVSPEGFVYGARCPITCDAGYRLKNPFIKEYVCMGPTRYREIKYTEDGIEKIKKEYHNSFGHLLCVEDRCDIPAGSHYITTGDKNNYCKIHGDSVDATSDGCVVDCAPGYK